MKGCSYLKNTQPLSAGSHLRAATTRTGSDRPLGEDAAVLTPLAVGALVGLGFVSFAVGGGGGVRGGAGAATVFLLHRGRVSDGALVAVVVCGKHGAGAQT